MDMKRLKKQMDFILEIDKEKNIKRQTLITDASRQETDAEHAWHLAVMCALLSEYSNEKIDVAHTMLMVLMHDLVEIDAGDTYDKQAKETIRAVVDKLGLVKDDWALGFQCRFDKRRTWLNPFVSEAITTLESKNPIGRLFVIAPNFSIDCLETFYDIEIELREQFCTHHSGEFIYIPCLNDSQAQVALLADEVSAALGA